MGLLEPRREADGIRERKGTGEAGEKCGDNRRTNLERSQGQT